MLFAALRDMQWRRRRFFIAVVSTGLVLAMTLGQPMVTSIGIVGTPQQLPSGYQILDRGVAVGD